MQSLTHGLKSSCIVGTALFSSSSAVTQGSRRFLLLKPLPESCCVLQNASNGSASCYSAFTPAAGLPANGTTIILGVPFLRSYFTTYTYNEALCNPTPGVQTNVGCTGQAQLGIAPATMASGTSPALGPAAAAAAARGNVAAPATGPAVGPVASG